MIRMRRGVSIAVLTLALIAAPTASLAQEPMGSEAGIGALSALSTLVYGPVKIVYATLGLIIGGTAWGLSGGDNEVLNAVVSPAVRGDYVVTPSHLRMEKGLEFYGQEPQYREVQHAAAEDIFMDDAFIEEDY